MNTPKKTDIDKYRAEHATDIDPVGSFAFVACMILAVAAFGYGIISAIF